MALDEHTRHHLHELARQSWDDVAADTLMEMLPPVGWADVATKRDLDALEERMNYRFDGLRHEMDALRFELRGEMHALHARTLRWILPTMLTGVGLTAALVRLT